jgi:hypothetical protein
MSGEQGCEFSAARWPSDLDFYTTGTVSEGLIISNFQQLHCISKIFRKDREMLKLNVKLVTHVCSLYCLIG